jgi:uncharacterized delta-60 repeat protein
MTMALVDVDNSVWYSWTAPVSGTVTFDTIGSDFDTVLSVYTTPTPGDLCDPNLVFIGADDNSGEINDPGFQPTSQLTFTAVAGTTYYVAVEGNEDTGAPFDAGDYVLNWSAVAGPTNDYFTNATVLPSELSGFYPDSNVGATTEPGEPTYGGVFGASVWYQWTAPTNGDVSFYAFDSFNTELLIYTGSNISNLTLVTIGSGSGLAEADFTATAGQVYDIAVAGDSGESGDFELDWFVNAAPPPPPNDNFSAATVLTGDSGSTNVDNTSATAESGEPNHAGLLPSKSVWYQWTAPSDGEVTLDTLGSMDINSNNLDTVLGVYTGNNLATLNQVAANDDLYPQSQFNESGQNYFYDFTNGFGGGLGYYTSYGGLYSYYQPYVGPSGLRFNAKAGVTYYFAVDTKAGSFGNISFNWAYHPSGMFRFATEDIDQTGTGMLLYKCSETEGLNDYLNGFNDNYFDDPEGVLVTVTRVAGSFGRVQVDYATADGKPVGKVNGDGVAVAGIDYEPVSGTLTFDDYEMSKTIFIPVSIYGGNGGTAEPNRDFSVVLSNPRRDPQESAEVSPPRVDANFGAALVRILDANADPQENIMQIVNVTTNFLIVPFQFNSEIDIIASNGAPASANYPLNLVTNDTNVDISGFVTNAYNLGTNVLLGIPSTNAFVYSIQIYTNIDPADDPITFDFTNNNYRVLPTTMNGTAIAKFYTNNLNLKIPLSYVTNNIVWVSATNDVFNFQSAHYRIPRQVQTFTVYVNRYGPSGETASVNYHINNYFLTKTANSDERNIYFPLQPGSDYANPDPATSGAVVGRNPDFNVGAGDSGTLNWAKDDVEPKGITFTIENNGIPEFNKDFQIELYGLTSKGVLYQAGMVAETTVTILADDNNPPAGSVDENYNQDFGVSMIPPVNTSVGNPGADGEVYALKVLSNNQTIIGGHFPSYSSGNNTYIANNVARINADGSLDTSFQSPPTVGVNDFVTSLAVDSANRVLVGGSFLSYDGMQEKNIARLNANGSLDTNFTPGLGANGPVWAVVQQPDGQILIGGEFTSYNGTTRNHIARLNSNGTLDLAFDPGTSLNSTVYALSLKNGLTTNVNVSMTGTNQLENDNIIPIGATSGTITINYNMLFQTNDLEVYYGDTTGPLIYDTGLVTNATQLVIPFAPTNGIVNNTITIVVNPGSVQPGTNWNYTANIQGVSSFLVAVGGDFTAAGGITGQDHVTRLESDGAVDSTFDPGAGINGTVRTLSTQADGKLVVGGDFTLVNGQSQNRLARLNVDGSLDTGFYDGSGADATVYDVDCQTNGTIYVGGAFTTINGTHRLGFARLNSDGSLDTSFMDTAYNQFAGLPRTYYNDNINNAPFVHTSGVQSDGNVMIGGSFQEVGGGQFASQVRTNSYYTSGLSQDTDSNPLDLASDVWPERWTRDGVRNRNNVARLIGGATAGPGNLVMDYNSYVANKSSSDIFVTLLRTNGFLGYASANFSVIPGVAQSGVDYSYYAAPPLYPIAWEYVGPSRMHGDGLYGQNTFMNDPYGRLWSYGTTGPAAVNVSVLNNPLATADYSAQFQLANPSGADKFYLGGENIPLGVALGGTAAPLTIVDDSHQSGTFGFASPDFVATNSPAFISVTRTNGTYGTVQLSYTTVTNGSTAVAGVDYTAAHNTLVFNDGQAASSFNVPILGNSYISPVEKFVNLQLFNLSPPVNGLATLNLSNAVLRIINPNFPGFLNFTADAYGANLSAGFIPVTVSRTVGSQGSVSVQYITLDGPSATNGVDYVGFTNTLLFATNTLYWNAGDVSPKTFNVPLLPNNVVGPNKQFEAVLFNSALNGVTNNSLLGTATTAVLTISNDNSLGSFQFSAPSYAVNENGGYATVTIVRSGVTVGSVPVNFTTADNTAFAGTNYVATNGMLVFAQGEISKSFTVPILDDGTNDPTPFNFMVSLSVPAGVSTGSLTNVPVNIVDAETYNRPPGTADTSFDPATTFNASVLSLALQSNGQILAGGNFTIVNGIPENYVARINSDGTLDQIDFPHGLTSGANGPVRAVLDQTDDNIVLGGVFTAINGITRNHIARLLTVDGSLDTSFNPGSGADNSIYALAETFIGGARYIYAGGAFTTFNSSSSSGIVRLDNSGNVDPSFAIGLGANAAVYAVAAYPTNSPNAGQVLIGGVFTNFNGMPLNGLARLNANGSVDTNFAANLGSGASNPIRAVAIQSDGRILIGGDFTNFNGVALNYVARLNHDGTLDTNFTANLGVGANGSVFAIALQADNGILLAGQFTTVNGVTRNGFTRLLPNGAADPTINFGSGANADVDAVVVQPADQMLVIGGGFTQFGGQPHNHIARLYGGSEIGTGSFEFTSPVYQVNENGLFATVSVVRTGGTSGSASVDFYTTTNATTGAPAATAVPGINYSNITQTIPFPPGEVFETVSIPVYDDFVITPNLTVNLVLTNTQPPAAPGDQPTAVLTIVNTDSAISFSSSTYQRPKNAVDGVATIDIIRQGSTNGTGTVEFLTTTNGTAIPGTDYLPITNAVTFDPGVTDVTVKVPVIPNNIPEGNTTVGLQLLNATGSLLSAPSNAVLTIIDTVEAPGTLSLSTNSYTVSKGGTNAYLTVVRTAGSSGSVGATYSVIPGTAVPGLNYNVSGSTVSLPDGATNGTIIIPLINNNIVQGNVNFTVDLSNPTGNASLAPPTSANVTILEDNVAFAFDAATNIVSETNGAVLVQVDRLYGASGTATVNYSLTNGTATNGVNYIYTNNPPSAFGTLTFTNGETAKAIYIPILHDTNVTGDLTFTVGLSSPSIGTQLTAPSISTVIVQDAEAGLSLLTNPPVNVFKSDSNAVITVICSNTNVEPVSVDFSTAPGTALAGVDFYPTNGTLVFSNGIATNTFSVVITNDNMITGNRTFTVQLSNPTAPGKLVAPTNQVVTIIDGNSGISFSSPTYTVAKSGVTATINVLRTGYNNSTVSVDFLATNGTATSPAYYYATNGTLTFTNGQTSSSFSVVIIDNTQVQPNKTVQLQLLNPVNTGLLSPSTATLTIFDNSGSLVIPAGTTLVTDSDHDDIISTNETVTLLFAFRDAGGLNVTNLNATLLATNGITAPSALQNYGPLTVYGPSVFRPFTFTVDPTYTNGQQIAATFNLTNTTPVVGSLGTAVFYFTLGNWTMTFANTNTIVINDNTNATPYPSTNFVSGLGSSLLKATVVFAGVTHGSPSDIDTLLGSPSQQGVYLMANAGGGDSIDDVTLTFDDNATNNDGSTNFLPVGPFADTIVTSTNHPTVYGSVATFPPSVSPNPSLPNPSYSTNLSSLNGSNPNGTWSLFVLDHQVTDDGFITNGWLLNLTTADPVGTSADVGVGMTASTSPVVVSNDVTFVVTVTNYGPSTATNVVVTDSLPVGVSLVSTNATPVSSSIVINGSTLTWNLNNLATNAGGQLTIVVQAVSAGALTNFAVATTATSDPNPDDDTAAVIVSVVPAQQPVLFGGSLVNGVFYLSVTNGTPVSSYIIQASTNLVSGNWVNIFTGTPPLLTSPFILNFTNQSSSNYPVRFYRALIGP